MASGADSQGTLEMGEMAPPGLTGPGWSWLDSGCLFLLLVLGLGAHPGWGADWGQHQLWQHLVDLGLAGSWVGPW